MKPGPGQLVISARRLRWKREDKHAARLLETYQGKAKQAARRQEQIKKRVEFVTLRSALRVVQNAAKTWGLSHVDYVEANKILRRSFHAEEFNQLETEDQRIWLDKKLYVERSGLFPDVAETAW